MQGVGIAFRGFGARWILAFVMLATAFCGRGCRKTDRNTAVMSKNALFCRKFDRNTANDIDLGMDGDGERQTCRYGLTP